MKHISILIPYGHTSLVNIEGSHQVFNYVNHFLVQTGRAPYFQIELVGLSREAKQTSGLFTVNPEKTTEEIKKKPTS